MTHEDATAAQAVEQLKAYLAKGGAPAVPDLDADAGSASGRATVTQSTHADYLVGVAGMQMSVEALNRPHATHTAYLNRPVWTAWAQRPGSPLQLDIRFIPSDSQLRLKHRHNSFKVNDWAYVYFQWTNTTGQAAVVDLTAPVVLNGAMSARAGGTFLGGGRVETTLFGSVSVLRGDGWGADSGKPHPAPFGSVETFTKTVAAKGRSIYRSSSTAVLQFAYEPFNVSWKTLIVPDQATIYPHVTINARTAVNGRLDDSSEFEFFNNDHALRLPYMVVSVR